MVEKIDLPPETCPDIDMLLDEVKPLALDAYRLYQQGENLTCEDAVDFVDRVDTLLRGMPETLEDLRKANAQLREAAHGYYARLKDAEKESANG